MKCNIHSVCVYIRTKLDIYIVYIVQGRTVNELVNIIVYIDEGRDGGGERGDKLGL